MNKCLVLVIYYFIVLFLNIWALFLHIILKRDKKGVLVIFALSEGMQFKAYVIVWPFLSLKNAAPTKCDAA